MTTEELEQKLKISKNTCIHCPTLEVAHRLNKYFQELIQHQKQLTIF